MTGGRERERLIGTFSTNNTIAMDGSIAFVGGGGEGYEEITRSVGPSSRHVRH